MIEKELSQIAAAEDLDELTLTLESFTEPGYIGELTAPQVAGAILAVQQGRGEPLHSGGESEIYRVGELVVKRFHDLPNNGKWRLSYREELEMIAAALNGGEFNVHVRALSCSQDPTGRFVVAPLESGPNLSDLYHYAAYQEAGGDCQDEPAEVLRFVEDNAHLCCPDFIRQIDDLMRRMARLDPDYYDCTAHHSHFLVAQARPSSDPYRYQELELILIDRR